MQNLYDSFFDTCKSFDQFLQEQKWKLVTNKSEFKAIIESEYSFWKRVLTMMPPEKRLLKEFAWMQECYFQIIKHLDTEKFNWKIRWLKDNNEKIF